MWGFDDEIPADRQLYVTGVREHQIAGPNLRRRYRYTVMDLLVCGPVQRHSGLGVGPLDQTGAVETVRPGCAPDVRPADATQRRAHRGLRASVGTTPAAGGHSVTQRAQIRPAPARTSACRCDVRLLGPQARDSAAQKLSGGNRIGRQRSGVCPGGGQHGTGTPVGLAVVAMGLGEDSAELRIDADRHRAFGPPRRRGVAVSVRRRPGIPDIDGAGGVDRRKGPLPRIAVEQCMGAGEEGYLPRSAGQDSASTKARTRGSAPGGISPLLRISHISSAVTPRSAATTASGKPVR